MATQLAFLPRLIRLRDAPIYLGMDIQVFNLMVRPFLSEIKISTQRIVFDRLDLDAWVEDNMPRGSDLVSEKRREENG